MSKESHFPFDNLGKEFASMQKQWARLDTRYNIQETLFNVGLYTETLAQ